MFKSLELQLIAQVRKHKYLYDKRFRNFEHKKQLWQQVGNVIGISALTAKHRWTSLKNRYLRVRKNSNPANEWQFYNYLRFLDDVHPIGPPIKKPIVQPEQRTEILIESRLEEIPQHIRKSITNSEPTVHNAKNCNYDESKMKRNEIPSCDELIQISNDEACSYELKLSNEDCYTYELKISNTDTCNYGQNYDLNKIIRGRKTYGKQVEDKDDCKMFAQFVEAKLRALKSDADRDAMKQRILHAINYSPESVDDGILDIVFIE